MLYFCSLFFGTFVLEDVALATGIALMATHKINLLEAFIPCFLGICVGDLGLYLLGYALGRFEGRGYFSFLTKYRELLKKMRNSPSMQYSIIVSRMIPGTRMPTYLGAGFFRFPLGRFFWLTLISVFAWVSLALLGGDSLLYFIKNHWVFVFLLMLPLLHGVRSLALKVLDPWQRKALKYTWKKYLYFEFWPAWFFYLPIVPIYIFLSLKHRSFFMPFYANPNLSHGGLIGESKWDFLKHLNAQDPSTLPSVKISKDTGLEEIQAQLEKSKINYPFIIKPDVGQRGFAVRILHNPNELNQYLSLNSSDIILQKLSLFPNEAGVFYIRHPANPVGEIFSITDKKFPYVLGDGVSTLGDLILKDPRARMIAPTYFSRLSLILDQVLPKDDVQVLAECGNHCQGAIFRNGKDLNSSELAQEIDRISQQIPDFYFGRFDIRYESSASLRQGKNFEIVEVNGAGSEATHIWDSSTTLPEAYRTLFTQWSSLFEIGAAVHRQPDKISRVQLGSFLKECLRVFFRKGPLSTSS